MLWNDWEAPMVNSEPISLGNVLLVLGVVVLLIVTIASYREWRRERTQRKAAKEKP